MRCRTHILACWLCLAACGVGCGLLPKPRPAATDPAQPPGSAQPDAAKPASADGATQGQPNDPPISAEPAGKNANTDGANPATDAAGASSTLVRQGSAKADAIAAGPSSRRQQPADSQALFDALHELQVIGAIDVATQQRMIADLKQTDPALWPQLLQYYRASVLLHEKADQRAAEQVSRSAQPAIPTGSAAAPDAIVGGLPASAAGASTIQLAAASALITPLPPVSAVQPSPASVAQAGAVASTAPTQIAAPMQIAVPMQSATMSPPNTSPPNTTSAAALEADDPNGWEDHLHAAIGGLENATREPSQSAAEAGRHAALRMLYMIDGRREDALKPIRGISPGQQDFWSQEIYGLANYLDTERNPDSSRRAAEAVDRLREAAAKLGEQATLSVKNLAFCTEVTSFGVYKAFVKDEYRAGQEVLLYAEVENFKSRRDDKGYHTALRSSYQILDQHGARVESQDFEVTEEHCQNLRHDFFMRYHIWMPKRIYGGRYTLQLTIEDTLSQKIGQSSLEFTVKE